MSVSYLMISPYSTLHWKLDIGPSLFFYFSIYQTPVSSEDYGNKIQSYLFPKELIFRKMKDCLAMHFNI